MERQRLRRGAHNHADELRFPLLTSDGGRDERRPLREDLNPLRGGPVPQIAAAVAAAAAATTI